MTHPTVICEATLKSKFILSATALLQSMMVNSSGVTNRFSRPFCSIFTAQTNMICLLTLRGIEVLLHYSTYQFKLFKKNYKTNLCRNLSNEAAGNYAVKKLEISQLEFYTNNIEPFIKFLRDLKIDKNERME